MNCYCLFTQLFTHWTPPLCWVLGTQMHQRETRLHRGPRVRGAGRWDPGPLLDSVITQGRCWGNYTCDEESGAVQRGTDSSGVGQEKPPPEALWLGHVGRRNSPAGGRGPERAVQAWEQHRQRCKGRAEPRSGGKAAHCPPRPSRSPGACPWGPAVRSCVTRSWPPVPGGKCPSAALSQGAMAGTYPVSWPLEVAVTLKRCFVPLPRSSQRDGALLPKASCTDTLTSHMHG